MAKLNQIIAVLNGKKDQLKNERTEAYKTIQKPALFSGFYRTYQPKGEGEDVEKLPNETNKPQASIKNFLEKFRKSTVELLDLTAVQEYNNCEATADVVVDGKVLLEKVPVTYLLFLEKQLTDVRAFLNALPVYDPNEDFRWNEDSESFKTPAKVTNRTKKEFRFKVMVEPTNNHPAQIEKWTEDVTVGHWHTVLESKATTEKDKRVKVERVNVLLDAVKAAREEANSIEVKEVKVGDAVFDYIMK